MGAIDRTSEFFAAASAQVEAGVRPIATLHSSNGKKTKTAEAKEFGNKAADISKKIQLASKRLQRLAELTRAQGIFDDPGEEINSLAVRLKNDTKFLKIELSQLQSYLNSNKQKVGGGNNANDHSETVVKAMNLQLSNTTIEFQKVLEERQNSMAKKKERRDLYGQTRSQTRTPPLSTRNQQQQQQQQRPMNDLVDQSNLYKQQNTSFDNNNNNNNNGDENDDDEPLPLIQPTARLAQDTRYLQSRADAMSSINDTMGELHEVYKELAIMIQSQGEMVQRIDDDVEASHNNLNLGYSELVKSYTNMAGNKWLAAKIIGVLLFFITFFVTFFA